MGLDSRDVAASCALGSTALADAPGNHGHVLNDFYDELEDGHRTEEEWREIIQAAKSIPMMMEMIRINIVRVGPPLAFLTLHLLGKITLVSDLGDHVELRLEPVDVALFIFEIVLEELS